MNRSIWPFLFLLLLSAKPTTAPSIAEKCTDAVTQWKPRFEAEHLNYVVSPPFVIAGNGSAGAIARYRDGTILPSARALQSIYFQARPAEPIVIFLFESEEPYKRLATAWFNDRDVPHFGFYRPGDHVMFMNVATGTGTLVHELTHALMAPDFPDVPDWFNEGLASLYEQSSIGNGTITGLPNWRLPALKDAIRGGHLRSTDQLIEDPDFRSQELVGLNYAHARYIMLYLQEHHLLQKYYKQFRDHHADDLTGLATFKAIIAPQSVEEFDATWRKWVLQL